jgi:hypothetical protein
MWEQGGLVMEHMHIPHACHDLGVVEEAVRVVGIVGSCVLMERDQVLGFSYEGSYV